MHQAELNGLEGTVRKTHEWLNDIMKAVGANDEHLAYDALRAVLHVLRDRLGVDEAVQLAAQLPMLIRGLYYEGWSPRGKPVKTHKHEFLDAIRRQVPGVDRLPELLARAVFIVLTRHISPGEVRNVMATLPDDLRRLWPGKGAPIQRAE